MDINIAKDFTKTPGLRDETQTPGTSGKEFCENILLEAYSSSVESNEKLRVFMDGTNGFASSFLEEAFGGLARKYGADNVLGNLEIIACEQPYLKSDVIRFIMKVKARENG